MSTTGDGGILTSARPMTLVPLREDGTADIDALNAEFAAEYLADERNPRWVAKPTVAYLWARTVKCKNCRATIPLLKTCWLAKKEAKRVLLRMEPNADRTGVAFAIESDVPVAGGNNAQRREHDRRLGQGTMSRAGRLVSVLRKAGTVAMESEDIRAEAVAGGWAATHDRGRDRRARRAKNIGCRPNVRLRVCSAATDERPACFDAIPVRRSRRA